jgi:hypothetical protein
MFVSCLYSWIILLVHSIYLLLLFAFNLRRTKKWCLVYVTVDMYVTNYIMFVSFAVSLFCIHSSMLPLFCIHTPYILRYETCLPHVSSEFVIWCQTMLLAMPCFAINSYSMRHTNMRNVDILTCLSHTEFQWWHTHANAIIPLCSGCVWAPTLYLQGLRAEFILCVCVRVCVSQQYYLSIECLPVVL